MKTFILASVTSVAALLASGSIFSEPAKAMEWKHAKVDGVHASAYESLALSESGSYKSVAFARAGTQAVLALSSTYFGAESKVQAEQWRSAEFSSNPAISSGRLSWPAGWHREQDTLSVALAAKSF